MRTCKGVEQTVQEREGFFVDLYRAEYGSILAYARRRTDEATARDVAAETFLVAWRRLEEFQACGAPWLYRAAALVLKNAQRSDRRQGLTALRLAGGPAVVALDPADDHAFRAGHRYWCSAPTASVRLHRARRRLRDGLDAMAREQASPSPVRSRNRDTVPRDREAM